MIHSAFHIDQGPRENLEDCCRSVVIEALAPVKRQVAIAGVFDGVGGNNFGEIASDLGATQIVCSLAVFFATHPAAVEQSALNPDTVVGALLSAFDQANQVIIQQAKEFKELAGMASTAVCAVIVDGTLFVAWAGDSRCYLYDGESLRQITRDHKEIEYLIEQGIIDRQEAGNLPLAHTINRYLGQPQGFAPQSQVCRIRPGDVLLLCTDGLTDVLTDRQIERHIKAAQAGHYPFDDLPARLTASALKAKTRDNITVLACEYQPPQAGPASLMESTLTGAYPVELAKTLYHLSQETQNV